MSPAFWKPPQALNAASMLSGTSQDGLDTGIYRITSNAAQPMQPRMELIAAHTADFPDALTAQLRQLSFRADAPVRELLLLEQQFTLFCADALKQAAQAARLDSTDLSFIATHGQTLYHERMSGGSFKAVSLQLAGADYLAQQFGCPVVSDFRSGHIAAGGEGAPLAPILDHYCYRSPERLRIMLNLGGIANITVLRPGEALAQTAQGDTGPANKLMDQLMQQHGRGPWDAGGEIAASGTVDEAVLALLLQHPYFAQPFPKSTGPEAFNLPDTLERIAAAGLPLPAFTDFMATLSALTARSVSEGILRFVKPAEKASAEILVSGGGARNLHLLRQIQSQTGITVRSLDETGASADFKELQLFALLGYLTLFTEGPELFEPGKGVRLGKISLP
ncbi:MAG: anhydro-N-acetylmuramic acid kinase [Balneolales bacterium]|nr:anhydro-N-acetylmuramic acid kinase [Balneolales bacterium]